MIKIIDIIPTISVLDLKFGCDREVVRKTLGSKYKEIRKSILTNNTIDVYDYCHVYYSEDNKFEAIEIFGKVKVMVRKDIVYPGDVSHIRDVFEGMIKEGDCMIDKNNSVAITVSQDEESKVDAILFGKKGYFVQC